ncbi:MAG: hypothetical protein ACKVQB_03935 [Bacteroidia bacterium]
MNKSILKTIVFMACFAAIAFIIQSCNDPEIPPTPTNEEELITTLKVEMTDTLTGQKLNYFFRDLDGEGGKNPSQWDTIKLSDSSFYKVSLKFLNESNPNAIVDITQEILAEKTIHIICLNPVGINTTILRTDTDGTYQVGLSSTWKTGATSSGDVTIILKHQPGVKNGSCTPGETDVEVKFQTRVFL